LKHILLVCTGNTCRSAMAEAIFEDAVDRSSVLAGELKIDSAGTFACEGQNATAQACQVMEEMGLDLDRHKAKQIDAELVDWADLILSMEAGHIEHMEAMFPKAESKMFTLIGYAKDVEVFPGDSGYDIEDPYGEDVEEYRSCAEQLKKYILMAVEKIEAQQK